MRYLVPVLYAKYQVLREERMNHRRVRKLSPISLFVFEYRACFAEPVGIHTVSVVPGGTTLAALVLLKSDENEGVSKFTPPCFFSSQSLNFGSGTVAVTNGLLRSITRPRRCAP
jgi:hypothetical protein